MAGKQFSEDYQPSNYRTRTKLTLVLEAIKQENLLGTDEKTSKENAEKAVFAWMAKAAFNPTSEQSIVSNLCLGALIKKAWPDSKPSAEKVAFKYDKGATPSENAQSVLLAVADGDIAPDIGGAIIGMIKDTLQITESTELVKRLEELESKLTR